MAFACRFFVWPCRGREGRERINWAPGPALSASHIGPENTSKRSGQSSQPGQPLCSFYEGTKTQRGQEAFPELPPQVAGRTGARNHSQLQVQSVPEAPPGGLQGSGGRRPYTCREGVCVGGGGVRSLYLHFTCPSLRLGLKPVAFNLESYNLSKSTQSPSLGTCSD